MPDHFHILITPEASLERAVQFIKGGFSFRAKKELGSSMEIWQRGFSDHRIRIGKISRFTLGTFSEIRWEERWLRARWIIRIVQLSLGG